MRTRDWLRRKFWNASTEEATSKANCKVSPQAAKVRPGGTKSAVSTENKTAAAAMKGPERGRCEELATAVTDSIPGLVAFVI